MIQCEFAEQSFDVVVIETVRRTERFEHQGGLPQVLLTLRSSDRVDHPMRGHDQEVQARWFGRDAIQGERVCRFIHLAKHRTRSIPRMVVSGANVY